MAESVSVKAHAAPELFGHYYAHFYFGTPMFVRRLFSSQLLLPVVINNLTAAQPPVMQSTDPTPQTFLLS